METRPKWFNTDLIYCRRCRPCCSFPPASLFGDEPRCCVHHGEAPRRWMGGGAASCLRDKNKSRGERQGNSRGGQRARKSHATRWACFFWFTKLIPNCWREVIFSLAKQNTKLLKHKIYQVKYRELLEMLLGQSQYLSSHVDIIHRNHILKRWFLKKNCPTTYYLHISTFVVSWFPCIYSFLFLFSHLFISFFLNYNVILSFCLVEFLIN